MWVDLTKKLPLQARLGNVTAIRKWLAEWGTKHGTEAVVWRHARSIRIMAGTSNEATRVSLPDDVVQRLWTRGQRVRIWHNHPGDRRHASIAMPSAEDIALATLPGAVAVTTVDDDKRWTEVKPGPEAVAHPTAVKSWLTDARISAEIALTLRDPPTRSREAKLRREIRIAEAAVGAALAIDLIEVKGLSERGLEEGKEAARRATEMNGSLAQRAQTMPLREADQARLAHARASESTASRRNGRWTQGNNAAQER